jgi:hypothetical protein
METSTSLQAAMTLIQALSAEVEALKKRVAEQDEELRRRSLSSSSAAAAAAAAAKTSASADEGSETEVADFGRMLVERGLGEAVAAHAAEAYVRLHRDPTVRNTGRSVWAFKATDAWHPRRVGDPLVPTLSLDCAVEVTLLAPHVGVQSMPSCPQCGGKLRCKGLTKKGYKPVYGLERRDIALIWEYRCQKNGVDGAHFYTSDDEVLARLFGYESQLQQWYVKQQCFIKRSLCSALHQIVTGTPATVSDAHRLFKRLYHDDALSRMLKLCHQQAAYISSVQGKLYARQFITEANAMMAAAWQRLEKECDTFFSVDACTECINLHSSNLSDEQDRFILAHMPGSVSVAGDHVFSCQRGMLVRDEDADEQVGVWKKGTYVLVNGRHFVVSAVWVDTESYSALQPLFELVRDLAPSLQVAYVDKCCGPFSFGANITAFVANRALLIRLDLWHFLNRMPVMQNAASRAFATEMRRSVWQVEPAFAEMNLRDIPQSARFIPPAPKLHEKMHAVWDKWKDTPAACPTTVVEWWERAQVHIDGSCLSDPDTIRMSFIGADGRERTSRGTTGSCENVNRQLKRVCNKSYAYGPQIRAGCQRNVIVAHNMAVGLAVEGWPLVESTDLVLVQSVLFLAVRWNVVQFVPHLNHPHLRLSDAGTHHRTSIQLDRYVSGATSDYNAVAAQLIANSKALVPAVLIDEERRTDLRAVFQGQLTYLGNFPLMHGCAEYTQQGSLRQAFIHWFPDLEDSVCVELVQHVSLHGSTYGTLTVPSKRSSVPTVLSRMLVDLEVFFDESLIDMMYIILKALATIANVPILVVVDTKDKGYVGYVGVELGGREEECRG